MATLTTVRTAVRQDLHDEDATAYRWTDAVLNRHIARALKDFSYQLPFEVKTTIATTNAARTITLNLATTFADLIEIAAVEFPINNFPPTYQRFSLWQASSTTITLTMIGDRQGDGANAYIFWHKQHTLDTNGTTLLSWAEDIVALGAAGYAAQDWASYATNRVNLGGDPTVDHYYNFAKARLAEFQAEIRRRGNRGALRSSTLYRPYDPQATQSTDPGP